jgi:uncharacterized protein
VHRSLTRLWQRIRDLWVRAKREHSTPREVGWSVAIGVFCGCTPFLGLHMWFALGLATIFRLNRLWAFIGSRVSTSVLFAWIAFSEIEVACRLRTGAWMPLSPADILDRGWRLIGDWLMGTVIVGSALAALLGALAYAAARCGAPVTLNTPEGPLRPSSECRPSAPPAPTS